MEEVRNADFQTYIFHAPGRHRFWDDTDQYANFVTLTSIDAFRRIDANALQALQFWRTENESEGQFNTNWQADCTQKSVQHMSGCFSPEWYKLACQQKNTYNVWYRCSPLFISVWICVSMFDVFASATADERRHTTAVLSTSLSVAVVARL